MKKILFIIWSYTYGGGSESLLTSIINRLDPKKYDISILEYYHAEVKEESANSNIHILSPICSGRKVKMYFFNFLTYYCPRILMDKYVKLDYDLYIAFNYLIPSFLLPEKTKNIQWINGGVDNLLDKRKRYIRKKQDKAFDKMDKIVVISNYTEKSMIDLFPRHSNKLIKLYNGIDIDKIKKRSYEDTSIHLFSPSIVFVGRLEEAKGSLRLTNVLKLVHEKGIKAHLYFIGQGEQKDSIINKADRYGLSDYVHLLGYQQNPFPIMRQCDVVCLLSKSEGFSMCLLETLALDKPFVSTKIGGANELLDGYECGYQIETDEEAANAVLSLIEADKDKIAKECQESIKRFELNSYIEKIEDLIDELI